MVRAYNEVLGGELQPEVELLQDVEARWTEELDNEKEGSWWRVDRALCSLVAGHPKWWGRGWRGKSSVEGSRGGGTRLGLARLG